MGEGDSRDLAEADRQKLDEAATLFDRTWDETRVQTGPSPLIDDFLPADNEPLRFALLLELCKIDLQRRRRAGEHSQVEEYLERFPELAEDAHAVVRLILAEVEVRASDLADGPDKDRFLALALDEFRGRFPGQAALLESNWKTPPPSPPAGAAGHAAPPPAAPGAPAPPAASDPASAPSLPPGYTFVGVLGSGGMANVYKARQVSFGRLVAPEDAPTRAPFAGAPRGALPRRSPRRIRLAPFQHRAGVRLRRAWAAAVFLPGIR